MRFLRRNRFGLLTFALLVFCSLMVARQFSVNRSRHLRLREDFIQLFTRGYRPEAEQLYDRLVRNLVHLPDQTLTDDYQRTLKLVDPATPQPDNLIWRYHWTVRNELEARSVSLLERARQPASREE